MRTEPAKPMLRDLANRRLRFTLVGDLVQDIVAVLSQPLHLGGQAEADITHHRGGSAANIAYHLAQLNATARFVGRVGTDDTGDWLIQALHSADVEVCVTRSGKSNTVVCVVDDSGQRSFIADTAAAAGAGSGQELRVEHVADTDVLHLSGYWLCSQSETETLQTIVQAAKNAGVLITVDAGNFDRLRLYGNEAFLQLLGRLSPDILFLNQEEWNELHSACERLPVPIVVCTRGERPTQVYRDGVILLEHAVSPVKNIVDTTGAGDGFVAAFLYKFCRGENLTTSIEHGHALARQVILTAGAVPRTYEIE
ncbi:carbohydrate kinase family protein [Arthrobacter sp. NPDC058127]|uniref:carbohydrate kinase family protein n=1 Tax=Arthrobacter sp. NPDC058127 TaxID=3346351 RepID=UPI0036E8EEB6